MLGLAHLNGKSNLGALTAHLLTWFTLFEIHRFLPGVPDDEGRAPDELNLPSGDPSTRPSKYVHTVSTSGIKLRSANRKLFVNDDAAYKETITVVLDTKMSHWNKEAYTKLVSTLEKCSVSIWCVDFDSYTPRHVG